MTWNNYLKIFQWKMTRTRLWNSLYLSLGAAGVTMLAGTMISTSS